MTSPTEVHPWLPGRLRSRRRRRRKAHSNSASRQTALTTPSTRPANENSSHLASSPATRLRSTANRNLPTPGNQPGISQPMRSTPVEHPQTFLRPQHSQFPNLRANEDAERRSRLDHPEIRGVYKPARNDPRQDLTATCTRENISVPGLSSPALQQPPNKSFSGSPTRQSMTDPYREAREAEGERPGIIYPLLPRAARPDTRLRIDDALPEAAALDQRTRPPTVFDIAEPRLTEEYQPQGPRLHRRQSRKRRSNRSTVVYRPSKHSPPRGN